MTQPREIDVTLQFYINTLATQPGHAEPPEDPTQGEIWKDDKNVSRYFNGTEWIELKS